jgi:hypothetical protein
MPPYRTIPSNEEPQLTGKRQTKAGLRKKINFFTQLIYLITLGNSGDNP